MHEHFTKLITIILFITTLFTLLQGDDACCCDTGCVYVTDEKACSEMGNPNTTNITLTVSIAQCIYQGNGSICAPDPCATESSESESSESESSEFRRSNESMHSEDSSSSGNAAALSMMNIFNMDDYETYITGYWQGYDIDGKPPFPLNKVSHKLNYIPIAFINPTNETNDVNALATTWRFMGGFIYSKEQIKQWAQDINMRNTDQKVLLSICDSPDFHWTNVNIDEFSKSIARTVNEWDLAGVNIDAESEMVNPENNYVKTFILLIKTLKNHLSSDKIITYTCTYNMNGWRNVNITNYHKLILKECANDIEYIDTMNYWFDKKMQITAYKYFGRAIGDYNKVGIGVKAGNISKDISITTIKTVEECANWLNLNGRIRQKRMMLWATTRDIEMVTQKANQTYFNMIYNILIPHSKESDVGTELQSEDYVLDVIIKFPLKSLSVLVGMLILCTVGVWFCYCYAKK